MAVHLASSLTKSLTPATANDSEQQKILKSVEKIQSGDQDLISQGLEELESIFRGLIVTKTSYAKKSLDRGNWEDIESDLKFIVYQTAIDFRSGDFRQQLDLAIKAHLKAYLKTERRYQNTSEAFSDKELRIGDGANYNDFLEDIHAVAADELHKDDLLRSPNVDFFDSSIADEYSSPIPELADKDGFRQALYADQKPIWGANFPQDDHIIYHLGGILTRREMIFFDLAEGLSLSHPMPKDELIEAFGIKPSAYDYRRSKIKEKLQKYEDYLRDSRLPHGVSLETADPFMELLNFYTNQRNRRSSQINFEDFKDAYSLLDTTEKDQVDSIRGLKSPYSIPPKDDELKKLLDIDSNKLLSKTKRKLSYKILDKIAEIQAGKVIEEEDHPFWLVSPNQIKTTLNKLDTKQWSIADALKFLLPKMGHIPYKSNSEPKKQSSPNEIGKLLSLTGTTKAVERDYAIAVLTTALKAAQEIGFGKVIRQSPNIFENLIERLSSKRIRMLRRARELQDIGELTYESFSNLFKRWVGKTPSYQYLVKLAKDNNLDITPVHSPLDKPRVVRAIIKESRAYEKENSLTFSVLNNLIKKLTEHEFSANTIYNFAERHGLRLKSSRGHGIEGYIQSTHKPKILKLAKPLSDAKKLNSDMLNDIIEQVTGHRYSNPALSLESFIRENRLNVLIINHNQNQSQGPTAVESDRLKPEKLRLGKPQISNIVDAARPLMSQSLLTAERLNRIIHTETGRSFLREQSIKNFAKKNELELVKEPKTIFHDFDRGLDSNLSFRELMTAANQKYNDFTKAKKPNIDFGSALQSLVDGTKPNINNFDEPGVRAHILRSSLDIDPRSPLGQKLRTKHNYELMLLTLQS